MVDTVAEIVDIVLSDFLQPPDSQPTRLVLDGLINSSVTTLNYLDTYISPEEVELLGPGQEIQIGTERILIGEIDESTNTLSSLIRGANGTEAAEHADNSLIEVAPLWPRSNILRAVGDSIVGLWPDLFGVSDTGGDLLMSRSSYTEVPANVEGIVSLWVNANGNYVEAPYSFLNPFPPSSTGKAIATPTYFGAAGYATFKVRPTRPTSESNTLSSLAVDEQWVRLIVISTVAYLINTRDIDELTEEHIDASIVEKQPNQGSTLRDRLVSYERYLRDQARAAQRFQYPLHMVTM